MLEQQEKSESSKKSWMWKFIQWKRRLGTINNPEKTEGGDSSFHELLHIVQNVQLVWGVRPSSYRFYCFAFNQHAYDR